MIASAAHGMKEKVIKNDSHQEKLSLDHAIDIEKSLDTFDN